MMTNLFSIFDPSGMMSISIGWTSLLIFFFIYSPSVWLVKHKNMNFIKMTFNLLTSEFTAILSSKKKYLMIINISIFMFIFYNNFLGLMPYVFNSTSHMSITLSVALPLWIALNLFGWIKKSKHMFAHLVPQSTPSVLMPFMVIIETISNVIRPITLSIRLTANMIAGHLLMNLLGTQIAMSAISTIMPLMLAQLLLSTLETAVSIIQAYVFTILMTLYINEIPSE